MICKIVGGGGVLVFYGMRIAYYVFQEVSHGCTVQQNDGNAFTDA